MTQIIYNAIQCPDGTILESRHRHHFNEHTQADGRVYFVDGGLDYQHIGCSDDQWVNLAVTMDDPVERIREVFQWTSVLDKDGNKLETPVRRKLKDLTTEHVTALVEYTAEGYPKWVNEVFIRELEYRGGDV